MPRRFLNAPELYANRRNLMAIFFICGRSFICTVNTLSRLFGFGAVCNTDSDWYGRPTSVSLPYLTLNQLVSHKSCRRQVVFVLKIPEFADRRFYLHGSQVSCVFFFTNERIGNRNYVSYNSTTKKEICFIA